MTDWPTAQQTAAKTARWAVTMTKVRIRAMLSRTKWQLVTFLGGSGGESVGIVDLLALRKNHAACKPPAKRGDSFEIILIQVKGGALRSRLPMKCIGCGSSAGRTKRKRSYWRSGSEANRPNSFRCESGRRRWPAIIGSNSILRGRFSIRPAWTLNSTTTDLRHYRLANHDDK